MCGRFDGSEVLGDHIGISWYKDVRKARAYGKNWQHLSEAELVIACISRGFRPGARFSKNLRKNLGRS